MATIIIHSRTKEKISGTYCMEWSLHKFTRLSSGEISTYSRLVDKSKALSIIQRLGLVEVYRTIDGEIYDTPDNDLKKIFPCGVLTREEMNTIEKINNL